MPRAVGVLNPANAAEDTGSSFKEGMVKVTTSRFGIRLQREKPVLALIWKLLRLDWDTLEPLEDAEGGEVKDELAFGLGASALGVLHPGGADSPDEDDVEDLGMEVGTEGPALYISEEGAAKGWKLHPKTALHMLNESLKKVGWPAEFMQRSWAPDFEGSVFDVALFTSKDTIKGDDGKEHPITYKVVKAAPIRGYEQKGKGKKGPGKAASGGAGAGGSDKGSDKGATEDKVALDTLIAISEAKAGRVLSRKALNLAATTTMSENGTNPKLMVPVLDRFRSNEWLEKNVGKADAELDAANGTVTFGAA